MANKLQVVVLCGAAAYTAALFAPGYQVTEGGQILHRTVDLIPGWRLALLGWIGPLECCFAWFANIPLAFCAFKLTQGKLPGRFTAVLTACLALSALLPQLIFQPADGWHVGYVRGPAVWLWLLSIAVILAGPILVSRSAPNVR